MDTDLNAHKNEIARKLTDLGIEESQLLINRPANLPLMTRDQYLKRTAEIDEARKVLREELFRLCSQ